MRQKNEMPILQLSVRGPGVRSGRLPIPELVRICEDAQNAVHRQAEQMECCRPYLLQHGCMLELIGIKRGSTMLEFTLAEPPDATSGECGVAVISEVAATIHALGNGDRGQDIHPEVLQSVHSLAATAGTGGISEIEWIVPTSTQGRRMTALLNETVRDRAAARLCRPTPRMHTVVGVLAMADFAEAACRCRIDRASGSSVAFSFDLGLTDTVHSLLRQLVFAAGEGRICPNTEHLEFRLKSIASMSTLTAENGEAVNSPSIAELAATQGVQPLRDAHSLTGVFSEDEDIDSFLAEIYGARK